MALPGVHPCLHQASTVAIANRQARQATANRRRRQGITASARRREVRQEDHLEARPGAMASEASPQVTAALRRSPATDRRTVAMEHPHTNLATQDMEVLLEAILRSRRTEHHRRHQDIIRRNGLDASYIIPHISWSMLACMMS